MVRCKDFRRGIHPLMLVEEPTHIVCKVPVVGLPRGVQRGGSLAVGAAYRLPPLGAARDKCWQLCLALRNGSNR